jgi:hypothetical protein
MVTPHENQQTVEAAIGALASAVMSREEYTPALFDAKEAARAALRDLVAQAELAAELGDALAESLQHPDHVSDEVRKERNHHALTLLTRLDASRSLDWWGDSGAFARLDGAR